MLAGATVRLLLLVACFYANASCNSVAGSVERSPWQKVFLDYAILGDDLVIADENVAREYLKLMDEY